MRAEILSIGTEILLGHITDTNATYLAQQLAPLGIDLYFVSQVGDNQGRVTETLRRAWERADIIITTGGLGPTEDDVTREAIAALLQETPSVDPQLERDLREKFARFGAREMPERNIKQAWLIPSATTLPNPVGTAPGWFTQRGEQIIISMPGVPREMKQMWEEQAVPRLVGSSGETLFTRILRIAGMGESTVEERLGELIHSTNPTIATYAKVDAVDVRITAKAATTDEARSIVDAADAEVRAILRHHVFGIDKETLSSVVGNLLGQREWHLGAMESCTGGLLSSMLTDNSGSSSYMRGGIVSYATDLKVKMGVPQATIDTYGVISEETAIAMARVACTQLKAHIGIGITGVAGPEKQEDKPVGQVHIGIASPLGEKTYTLQLSGSRDQVKHRAAMRALDLLRQHLLEMER